MDTIKSHTDKHMADLVNAEFSREIENRLQRINAVFHDLVDRSRRQMSVNTSPQLVGFEKQIDSKLETLHNFILPGNLTEKRKRVILMYVEEIEILLNIDDDEVSGIVPDAQDWTERFTASVDNHNSTKG